LIIPPDQNKCLSRREKYALGTLAVAAAALPLAPTATRAEDVPSRVHFLSNFEFSNEYLTPRGMMSTIKGWLFSRCFWGW